MRSRVRVALETGLRAIAFAALAGLLWHAFHVLRSAPAAQARGEQVDSALVHWSTREAPGRVRVELGSSPDAVRRDWLAALARTGTAVSWGGAAPPPSAVAVEPVADPRHSSRVWLAAPARSNVLLRDGSGIVDSARIAHGGARVTVPQLDGTLRAAGADFEATSALHDSLVLRPVLVLGQASWEAKFVIAALEEHGWDVEARLAVAPSGDARQGAERVAIDTTRYAAVIAVDSVATRYATQLVRYVRAGGGLIAMGEGGTLQGLRPVLPASSMSASSLPSTFSTDAARKAPRTALALASLGDLEPGAIVLETRSNPEGEEQVAAAAWRVGRGRVLQIGYHDTWRWRLAGVEEDDPVREHRAWWAALVSSVAYAPRVALEHDHQLEPTPLASIVAAIGPPDATAWSRASVFDDARFAPVLFGLLLVALLVEWLSRRVRGAR